jgi:hypothetical protein
MNKFQVNGRVKAVFGGAAMNRTVIIKATDGKEAFGKYNAIIEGQKLYKVMFVKSVREMI